MDTYAFILGRQPQLSAAELLACLRSTSSIDDNWNFLSANQEVILIDLRSDLDVADLFHQLGGSVKLVRVFERLTSASQKRELPPRIADYLLSQEAGRGGITFGLSVYGSVKSEYVSQLPRKVKNQLAERGVRSRFVEPSSKGNRALSSAQVLKRGLTETEGGFEIAILLGGSTTYLGRTIEVQRFEEFAHRDFGKPERRIDPGLLPPKLARILVNLAGVPRGGSILDPFCGSGVVLAEGVLMGYRMTGLDCSEEATKASRLNLEWLKQRYPELSPWEVHRGEAQSAARRFGPFTFDAVVGEGDLGPIFSRSATKKQLRGLVKQYRTFYTTVLSELRSVVHPGGRVVLAVPRWLLSRGESVGLNLDSPIRLMGYRRTPLFGACPERVPEEWRDSPLVYQRQGQNTAREILCLQA